MKTMKRILMAAVLLMTLAGSVSSCYYDPVAVVDTIDILTTPPPPPPPRYHYRHYHRPYRYYYGW